MSEDHRPLPREKVNHDEQWRAAQASRREALPEIVVIKQTWSRWRTVTLVGVGILTGLLLGVGGLLTTRATAPLPPIATPMIIVLEITTTPVPTSPPSPTPSPSPTTTPTATATLSPSLTTTQTPTTPMSTQPIPATIAVIKARALNVRAGPGIDYDIVGYAARSQRYRIVDRGKNSDWLRIDFDGLEGWVSTGWVQIDDGVEDVPARGELR